MAHKFDCRLRHVRRKWGLSQRELAELLELSRQYVSAIERSERSPSREVVIACQVVFDEHLKDLFPRLWDEAEDGAVRGLYVLRQKLAADRSGTANRKLQLVNAALGRAVSSH